MVDFRITNRLPPDYYKKVTVSRTTFGDPNDGYRQDILIPFSTYGIIIVNEGPSVGVQLSYDGFNIHEELSTAVGLSQVTYLNRVLSKIWLKVASSSAAVSVRAWQIR
jgi:hypothetical protein